MHRLKAWGLSVAVLAGAGAPAAALADDPPAATAPAEKPTPWYKRAFARARPDAGARGVAPARPALARPLPPELLAEAVDAEQKAWQRRMDVCTELRRVAGEKNDEALLRRIDELERQATALYNQRTVAIGVKRAKTPAAELDRRLGSGAAVSPPTAADATDDETRTARTREVPR